jgi:hypothetical protein
VRRDGLNVGRDAGSGGGVKPGNGQDNA